MINRLFLYLVILIACKATIFIQFDDTTMVIERITPETKVEQIRDVVEEAYAKNKSVDIFLEKFEAEEIKK
jgi:hypothetical protein